MNAFRKFQLMVGCIVLPLLACSEPATNNALVSSPSDISLPFQASANLPAAIDDAFLQPTGFSTAGSGRPTVRIVDGEIHLVGLYVSLPNGTVDKTQMTLVTAQSGSIDESPPLLTATQVDWPVTDLRDFTGSLLIDGVYHHLGLDQALAPFALSVAAAGMEMASVPSLSNTHVPARVLHSDASGSLLVSGKATQVVVKGFPLQTLAAPRLQLLDAGGSEKETVELGDDRFFLQIWTAHTTGDAVAVAAFTAEGFGEQSSCSLAILSATQGAAGWTAASPLCVDDPHWEYLFDVIPHHGGWLLAGQRTTESSDKRLVIARLTQAGKIAWTEDVGASSEEIPAIFGAAGPSKALVLAPKREACPPNGGSAVPERIVGWQTLVVEDDAAPVAGPTLPIGSHACGSSFGLRSGPSVIPVGSTSTKLLLAWADGAGLELLGIDGDGNSQGQ